MADNEKLGSTSPQVLLKNAINLDKLVNDRESESLPDRFAVLRRTWFGMEKANDRQMQSQEYRFDTFIASSGYEVIGDYTAGPLTLTEYNQLIRYNNELYKLTAAADIPFTTAGNTDETWTGSDAAHFASVGDAALRQSLASGAVGVVSVDYVHLINGPSVTMEYFIATSATMNDAFIAACASGKTVLLRSDVTYQVSRNDFPVARGTNLIATGGSYATIEVLSPFGNYGLFDMSTENGLNGGRYNIFYGLKFRYPNQVKAVDGTVITNPVEYPPVFHGGAFESRFINLDMGNAYMAFRLGGAMNGRDLGSASRVVIDNIIGSPIYRGLSLEQV
ncbi:TPA: hypothetical protein QHC16_005830, partial [Klebsiella michiganensis]|nr:hypothetical protein [Klebsiella michiganensis]HDT5952005.1 hypothetical protein [Klebsiella michiganensis]HDT5974090.1 hypothetical protein [Klebsiella michiganensis]HDT5984766.1 hypothetical protein [Klebsiella michiganensis]